MKFLKKILFQIIDLKIDNNPFAKGFKDNGAPSTELSLQIKLKIHLNCPITRADFDLIQLSLNNELSYLVIQKKFLLQK